jgi:uncharacterized membrane protein
MLCSDATSAITNMKEATGSRTGAQQTADRIRTLRDELQTPEVRDVLALTPEQQSRFDAWSRGKLAELAQQYDVDTTVSQKHISWGMRIASTLGGLALCAAVVLFFARYWGYLNTPAQVATVMLIPLAGLAGTEYAARRERTLYFAGLIALVTLASFILNLAILGGIFNIASTERALLAWGAFAAVLAYRYGLRPMLVLSLGLLLSYGAAAFTARLGYDWLEFWNRPEDFAVMGWIAFAVPLAVRHNRNPHFPPVYRLTGALAFFLSIFVLAAGGSGSYLPLDAKTVERVYEFGGLLTSAGAIWLGIVRQWTGIVNTGSVFFTIFLFFRLYHWWWDWMPKYLFFAVIGALSIMLVLAFKRLRANLESGEAA